MRSTSEAAKIEQQLLLLFEARKKHTSIADFMKRVGEIYLVGSIDTATFEIAKKLYGDSGGVSSSTSYDYYSDPCGGGSKTSSNARC